MKSLATTVKKIHPKSFSVKALDKSAIKSGSFDAMRTSFAIEGIRFSEAQFTALKTARHFNK